MISLIDYPESTITIETYSELEEQFSTHLNDGLPQFNELDWGIINSKWDKETIRQALIIYIIENKCPFPYKDIEYSEVIDLFNKLKAVSFDKFVREPTNVTVGEYELNSMYKYKFEDEKLPFEKQGKLLIDTTHTYNRGSDFFQQINRYACGSWSKESPIKSWQSWRGLKSILGTLWRMDKSKLNKDKYISGIRLGLYNATQFKPTVAKVMYDMFRADKVIDISCGWGDRLFGFYVSNSKEYYGFDPNPNTYEQYKLQCKSYERILGSPFEFTEYDDHFECIGSKKVVIWNLPAEDVDYSLIPKVDLVFSSPPYFCTEKYAEGIKEDTQSWVRYKTSDDWQENFLHNVISKCNDRLNETGTIAINIIDGSVKGERQRICEKMVDYCESQLQLPYIGQLGMTMQQRPNTAMQRIIEKEENESNTEYTRRVATIEKDIVSKVPFIEPIFLFSKEEKDFDILRSNKEQIDDLFD